MITQENQVDTLSYAKKVMFNTLCYLIGRFEFLSNSFILLMNFIKQKKDNNETAAMDGFD